ncbi:MAG: peptidase M28 [Kaistia sp. SCN 65-12]|nr:MAG: peptidase M28 [Kaistia sp. SCN 65-12]
MVAEAVPATVGADIHALVAELFPICRSIAGEGLRETLRVLRRRIDLTIHEVPTGTQVLDWVVPKEWTIRDGYIRNAAGERVVDFRVNNLHVMNYSVPIRAIMDLETLRRHVFTLPDQPDAIPYRKSYFEEGWGFCMTHRAWMAMPDGRYEVMIDSSHDDGSMSYGEYLHRGSSDAEVLLSSHICHPSLANDNCSGPALLALVAAQLAERRTRYSYRFLWAPGTLGAIAWLARNRSRVGRIRHGLVVACVGDGGGPTYKRSRRGNALVDRAAAHVLRHAAATSRVLDFSPVGYDERQFGSPGFDLPVGLFQRSLFGSFPEYHTSADDLDFVRAEHLASSYAMICAIIDVLEQDHRPVSLAMHGEPMLSRHGLYAQASRGGPGAPSNLAMLWTLNLADGRHSLLDIAERADLPFAAIASAARCLREHGLLAPVAPECDPPAPELA